MLPWRTIIVPDKDCDTPIYLQIANAIIQEMKKGESDRESNYPAHGRCLKSWRST